MPEAEKFSSHLPAVLAATAVTVVASLGTSYLGWTGTLTGVVAASLITGGGAWWVERFFRRSAARTKALAEARKRKGRPLSPAETSYIAAISDHQEKRKNRGIPWKTASLCAGAVLAATVAVIAFIELGTGKPVSAVVRGDRAHGLVVPVTPSGQPGYPGQYRPSVPQSFPERPADRSGGDGHPLAVRDAHSHGSPADRPRQSHLYCAGQYPPGVPFCIQFPVSARRLACGPLYGVA